MEREEEKEEDQEKEKRDKGTFRMFFQVSWLIALSRAFL